MTANENSSADFSTTPSSGTKGEINFDLLKETIPSDVSPELVDEMRRLLKQHTDLSSIEQKWLDDNCLRRYLRARNMNVKKAYKMLEETIAWRRSFGVEGLLMGDLQTVKKESETGKTYVRGTDKAGRAVLYMKPRNQNSKGTKGQLDQLVYTLERARGESIPPQEKITLLLDFKGYSMRNAPSIKTMRETLNILQNHYPETLGIAVCVEAPALFSTMYKMIKPFIDPDTAKKIQFVSKTKGFKVDSKAKRFMEGLFNKETLETEFGGSDPEPYNNAKYFSERFVPEYMK
uniref:CRAL-TRIO domain-containing protein n=1 Tax=Rhodosorus marinus TaxID=101924 RepID=A0A7S0BC14_9RHOD|mmetsp:Transcript_10049/g.14495  ORF Transcript_10049/g.14495 Transcript_10049/m.14495 type:complete len:290 (+) Transcript_10049:60-929(+)